MLQWIFLYMCANTSSIQQEKCWVQAFSPLAEIISQMVVQMYTATISEHCFLLFHILINTKVVRFLSFWQIAWYKVLSHFCLIYIFLITREVENFSMWLLAIHLPFVVNCPFMSFTHFSIWLFFRIYRFLKCISCIVIFSWLFLLHLLSVPLNFVQTVFAIQKFLITLIR